MLQELADIAFGDAERRQLVRVMISMVVIVLLMTGVLRRIQPPANFGAPSSTTAITSSR
jgi:hypothetical protein